MLTADAHDARLGGWCSSACLQLMLMMLASVVGEAQHAYSSCSLCSLEVWCGSACLQLMLMMLASVAGEAQHAYL